MKTMGVNGYFIDPANGFVHGRRGPIRKISGRYISATNWPGGAKYVHRIIWESVNGQIPDGLQINHKNGVRTDNRIENLELVTPSENTKHAYRLGLIRADGVHNGRCKLNPEIVAFVRTSNTSNRSLAAQIGVSPSTIRDIRLFRNWNPSKAVKS